MNEKILIVEDDMFMADQLSLLLRKLEYRVAGIAASGEAALAQAAQVRPDLIIMDSLLEGGVDGIEAAQRINETHPTPVLFLAAHDDEAFFQRAKNNQPYAFLLKPPSERELAIRIKLALYRHQVEHQQAQDVLLRYRTALDSSADAIYLIDRESMQFVDMNETACNTLGYTREELLGMGPQDIKPFFNRDMLAARFDEIIASGQDGVVQTEHQRRDGSRFPVEVILRANEASGQRLMVAIARDISDRVEAERTLRESEQRFRQLADNINEAFWIRDVASGNILYASPAYEKILERSLENLYAHPRSFVGMVHADDRERVSAFVERLYTKPAVDALEYRIVGKDGRVRWIWAHAFPVTDENGKIYRIAGVSEEVTQRRESEELYRTIVQSSMDGFWAVDAVGRCLDVNEAYCQLIGYTREELLTMTVNDIDATESPEQTEAHMRRIIETGHDRFETRHRHRNGNLIDVDVSAKFVDTAEGGRFYVFVRDMSAHKQHEERLRLSEEKFRMLFEHAPLGLGIVDKDYRLTEVNRAICRLLDYSPAELTTKTFVEITHPRDVETDVALARLLFAGEIPFYTLEHRLLKRDGSPVWVNLTVTVIQDSDGQPMCGLGMIEDISARKRAEQERLAHEAAQRDALVREVHHRIKNNLHGVLGLLRQHTARHPETAAVIEEAINQIGAVAAVHGLQGSHTGDNISLQNLLREIIKLARSTIGTGQHPELRNTLPGPVLIAAHEVVAIALVLNELLLNAIKHGAADSIPLMELHDGGGKAHIAITNRGQLPPGFDYDKGRGLGVGLGLVKALMPRKGSTLSLRQEDDRIIATLHLEAPVVVLDGRAEGA